MARPRLTRAATKALAAALVVLGIVFFLQWPTHATDGTGLDKITWSGRIRIEWQLHEKPGPPHSPGLGETVSGGASRDEVTTTEYQVERLPHDAGPRWHSADVRVQVRGNKSFQSDWVWKSPDQTEHLTTGSHSEGSGATVAGVALYLRGSGKWDKGHCRLELGPIGERDDGGPLTRSVEFRGSSQGTSTTQSRWGTNKTNYNNPVSLTVSPDSALVDIPCARDARSVRGDKVILDSSGQHRRITYDLFQDGVAQTEVEIVPPKEYDQWEPQAGETESELGNFIDLGIVAHTKGDPGLAPPQKILRYTIQLEDTSKERGVDLNTPEKASQRPEFDMKIDEDNPWIELTGEKKDAQAARTKEDDLHEFRVTVNSYDWGGSTKVKVTAQLEDGSTVVAHVRGHQDQDSLALPKDDNSNHIADSWEHKYAIPNPNEDADDDADPPGDGNKGDSIALYDEYRGFHIQGKHESLSPEKKDLFVHDQDNLGVGLYARITKIAVHTLKDNEREQRGEHDVASPNGNRQTVYAIWLHKGAIGDGGLGDTNPGPGVPATIRGVTIDSAAVAVYYPKYPDTALPAAISHELGHATNIRHHGDGLDYLVGDVLCRRPDGSVQNFLCSSPVPGKPGVAAANCFLVAVKGGAFSGNDICVMRYDTAALYEHPRGNCEWKFGGQTVRGKKYGQDPPGTSLCQSREGTGVNAASNPDNKAGDASEGRGECEKKFRLK